jgi:hypothetical protein
MPGFDPQRIDSLSFFSGQRQFRIKRTGATWRFDDGTATVDLAALDGLFTALRGGRWHRRADTQSGRFAPAGVHEGRGIVVDGVRLTVGFELAGTGQRWIVRGDEALLVDGWVANALALDRLALRVRRPLDCNAPTFTATTSTGTLRVLDAHMTEPKQLWLDRSALDYLADLCARIEIVELDGKPDGRQGLHVVATGELRETGVCANDHVYVDTNTGTGCVEGRHVRELAEFLAGLATAPRELADPRPLPIDPVKLMLRDRSVLELDKRPRIGGADADPDAVRALVAALGARGTIVTRPAGAPRGSITATDRAGTHVTLELFDKVVARAGEPGAIALDDASWQILMRPSAALRDATRWREDVVTLTSITLDRVTYERGSVLGEWTREPSGPFDPKLVDALAESLAMVRAPIGDAPRAIAHRVRVTFAPPAGSPITHTLEIGAPSTTGCAARLDNAATGVRLEPGLCMAVLALATRSARD